MPAPSSVFIYTNERGKVLWLKYFASNKFTINGISKSSFSGYDHVDVHFTVGVGVAGERRRAQLRGGVGLQLGGPGGGRRADDSLGAGSCGDALCGLPPAILDGAAKAPLQVPVLVNQGGSSEGSTPVCRFQPLLSFAAQPHAGTFSTLGAKMRLPSGLIALVAVIDVSRV